MASQLRFNFVDELVMNDSDNRYDGRFPEGGGLFSSGRRRDGSRDDDWMEDHDHPSNYRYGGGQRTPRGGYGGGYDDEDYYEPPRRPRRQAASSRGRGGRDDDYDRDDEPRGEGGRKPGFCKRHPVFMNLIYIIVTAVVAGWIVMWFLDYWTFHGQERAVPDVKGLELRVASANVEHSGLRAVVSDSVFDSKAAPGTVVEQTPIPNARIKKGGSVYLTIVAFTPKMVTVPDFYNVSARQARSMFEGLGISAIREVSVPSEYAGLVLGAKFNGVELRPGARIPMSAVITLEVGQGIEMYDEPDSAEEYLEFVSPSEEVNIE